MKKVFEILKKAPLPIVLTSISFVLFVAVYLLINLTALEPVWFKGLVFALPFVCFFIITFLALKEKFDVITTRIVSIGLVIVLCFAMPYTFVIISLDIVDTETTNVNKYQRVLKIKNYPDNKLIYYFPNEIPDDAKNISFYYRPRFFQSSEVVSLKFESNPNSINKSINDIVDKTIWIGNSIEELKQYGINDFAFTNHFYETFPDNYTFYLISSDISNHGDLCFVAVSDEENQIMFYSSVW